MYVAPSTKSKSLHQIHNRNQISLRTEIEFSIKWEFNDGNISTVNSSEKSIPHDLSLMTTVNELTNTVIIKMRKSLKIILK